MNKKAFTLAEVLITLGVIGVVAAITMPTLINNYQKHVWTTKFKKAYSEISQGFKLLMAEEEVSSLLETEAWSTVPTDANVEFFLDGSGASQMAFWNGIAKRFSGSSVVDTKIYPIYKINGAVTGWNSWSFFKVKHIILPDGVAFGFSVPPSNAFGNGSLTIDINGDAKPNTLGRDIFNFDISKYGILIPEGAGTWNTSDSPWLNCTNLQTTYGRGCTARLLQEGKMNY